MVQVLSRSHEVPLSEQPSWLLQRAVATKSLLDAPPPLGGTSRATAPSPGRAWLESMQVPASAVPRQEPLTSSRLPDASVLMPLPVASHSAAESSPACADPQLATLVSASRVESHLSADASCLERDSPKASSVQVLMPSQSLAVSAAPV
jgi:hypothetical protein